MTRYLILILLFFLASVPAYSQIQYKGPYGFVVQYNELGGADFDGTVDVDLDADEVGLSITANSTQTSDLVQMFASDGTTKHFSVAGDGRIEGTNHFRVQGDGISIIAEHTTGKAMGFFGGNSGAVIQYDTTGSFLIQAAPHDTVTKESSGGAGTVFAIDDGKIGIGSDSSPDYFFDVQGTMNVDGKYKRGTQSASCTCSDDPTCAGDATAGTLTLEPTADVVNITNPDPNGCTVTLSETNAINGHMVRITAVSNTGGTIDFNEATGVLEANGNVQLDIWDVLGVEYTVDRWVAGFTSNN